MFGAPSITHLLIEALLHPDSSVREQAAGALRNITFKGSAQNFPRLIRMPLLLRCSLALVLVVCSCW